tara:strand:+ start:9010 stop:10386 length:1377 start_codon:yes stop_codon:yes gene_type:complete
MKRSTGCASCALIALAGTSLAFAGSGIPESQILLPTGNVGDDSYGWSAAMDGDDIAIGAPLDNVIGANNGSVTVINGSDVQVLSPANTGAFDYFGYSVDISGDVLIAGSTIHPIATREGAAYIYRRDADGTWIEEAMLVAPDGMYQDSFGCAVAIDGDTAVVGAFLADTEGTSSGSAYVFTYDGTAWSVQQQLDADQATVKFGASVDIAGDTILVGSPRDNVDGISAGGAYVFGLDGGAWTQQARLVGSTTVAYDYFGYAVELDDDGSQAVIGAIFSDVAAPNAGAAYVFEADGSGWSEVEQLVPSGAEAWQKFGSSVSIDGNRAVIGAYGYPDSAGHGYIYESTAGGWVESVKLVASNGIAGARVGYAAAVSGNRALLGAPWQGATDTSGSGYLYDLVRSMPRGDSNRDGKVNVLDILDVLASWGSCPTRPAPCNGDIDRNGRTGVVDLLAVLAEMN